MPDTAYAVPVRDRVVRRGSRTLLLALLTVGVSVGCVTTRVVERPADDGAIDVPEAPPYRTVDDAAWGNGASREAPDVRVWMVTDQTYQRGDRVRALFRMREDGYVTIVRLDTDGRMRILYPRTPIDDGYVSGGRTYRVPGYDNASFLVDDPTGVGYVFAISSYKPFDYSRYAVGGRWDYVALAGRVRGDPFVAMRAFAERIASDAYTGYATDYAEYYVDRRVDYPRYAYPDCVGMRVGVAYDPYDSPCGQYVVVIYDDSYYYPYRYYPGTRVVYAPRPRYEWKPVTSPTPGGAQHRVAIQHRPRPVDLGSHRPGPVARGDDPGSTRPGDDVTPGGGRRRPDDPGSPARPPHYGAGGPRRDSSRVTPPPTVPGSNGNGNGGVGNGGANGGDDRANHGRGPRQDPATTRDGGHDRGRGRGNGDGRDDKRRAGDDSASSTRNVPTVFRRIIPARPNEPREDAAHPAAPPSDAPHGDARPGDAPGADTPAHAAQPPVNAPSRRGGDDHGPPADRPQGGAASGDDHARSDSPRAEPPQTESPRPADSPRRDEPRADDHPRQSDARPSDAPPPADRGRPAPPPERKDDARKDDARKDDARRDDARSKSDSSKDDDRAPKPVETRRRVP